MSAAVFLGTLPQNCCYAGKSYPKHATKKNSQEVRIKKVKKETHGKGKQKDKNWLKKQGEFIKSQQSVKYFDVERLK